MQLPILTDLVWGRIKLYGCLALAAAVAAFCGYQHLRLVAAEKAAQRADTARGEAVAQAAVLTTTLAAQNAAVDALKEKLASKQAAVRAAEAAAATVSRDAAARIAALQNAQVPVQCDAAVDWLRNQLSTSESGQ